MGIIKSICANINLEILSVSSCNPLCITASFSVSKDLATHRLLSCNPLCVIMQPTECQLTAHYVSLCNPLSMITSFCLSGHLATHCVSSSPFVLRSGQVILQSSISAVQLSKEQVWNSAVQCFTVQFSAVQCSASQYSTVQCSAS